MSEENQDPKRLVVIGAGGIGGWLISGLVRALEFQAPGSSLLIVDGDEFQPHNLERQVSAELMGPKAQVLAMQFMEHFPRTYIVPVYAWLVSAEAAERHAEERGDMANEMNFAVDHIHPKDLLQEDDVVYLCVDNYAARTLVFEAAQGFTNIDVFSGGNDEGLIGDILHYRRRNGEDITVYPPTIHPEFANPPDRNPGEMSCAERAMMDGGTQVLAINMAVAAALLAMSHLRVFDDVASHPNHPIDEVTFDLSRGAMLGRSRVHVRENVVV